MDAQQNVAIVKRWIEELFNQRNLAVADELVPPDHVNHDPGTPGIPNGPEGSKLVVSVYSTAFPDVRLSIEDQFTQGDRVVTRWSATGTHQGELMGIPPSGKRATVTGIQINRVANGKIAESWVNWDTLGLLQQIGAIPMPG